MVHNWLRRQYLDCFDKEVKYKSKELSNASKLCWKRAHSTTPSWCNEIWSMLCAFMLISLTHSIPEDGILAYFFVVVCFVLLFALLTDTEIHQQNIKKLPEYKAYQMALRSKGVKI